jgi:hypothetical protein
VATSLSFVFGIVVNELIELCIPHNILFTENGSRIIIMVREFSSEKTLFGWLEFAGVIPVDSENSYGLKEEEILKAKKELRVDQKHMEALKKNITKNLDSFI